MGILLNKQTLKNSPKILHNWEPPILNEIDSINFYLDHEDISDNDIIDYLYYKEASNLDNANKWLKLQSKEIQEKIKSFLNEI